MKFFADKHVNNEYCIWYNDGSHPNNNFKVDMFVFLKLFNIEQNEYFELKRKYNLHDSFPVCGNKKDIEFFIENVLYPTLLLKKLIKPF